MNNAHVLLLYQYCAIVYAYRAAAAAEYANRYALAMKDGATRVFAEKVSEDAYCAAGHAWQAKTGHDMTDILPAMKHAHQANHLAAMRVIHALNDALDIDPAIVDILEHGCKVLYHLEVSIESYRDKALEAIKMREAYIAEHGEAGAVRPVIDAEAVAAQWAVFVTKYPDAYRVPNTLAEIAELMGKIFVIDETPLTPESLAAAIVMKLTDEVGQEAEAQPYIPASLLFDDDPLEDQNSDRHNTLIETMRKMIKHSIWPYVMPDEEIELDATGHMTPSTQARVEYFLALKEGKTPPDPDA